jgi:hypothetical protein
MQRFARPIATFAAAFAVSSCAAAPSITPRPTLVPSVTPNATLQPSVGATTQASPTSSPASGYVRIEGLPITVLANEEADALFADVETCVSADGYTVAFPASWHTNAASSDAPACSWFAPEPFDGSMRLVTVRPPPPDGVWIEMRVVEGGVGYTSITPVYMTEPITIDGYEGHRAEFGPSTAGEIASRPEYRAYHYVIPFEEFGPTFWAGTNVDRADDYALAKGVVDRIMASTTFQRAP